MVDKKRRGILCTKIFYTLGVYILNELKYNFKKKIESWKPFLWLLPNLSSLTKLTLMGE